MSLKGMVETFLWYQERTVLLWFGLFFWVALVGVLNFEKFKLDRWKDRVLWLAALLVGAVFIGIPAHYLSFDRVMDHGELSVSVMSWLAWRGQQVYPLIDSPYDYANFYGPITYFFFGLFPKILGPSFLTMKTPCLILPAFFWASLYWMLRPFASRTIAFLGASLFLLVPMMFGAFYYWLRPDSLMLALATAGCLVLARPDFFGKRSAASLCLGLLLGFAINTKVQGALYFIPLFWFVLSRRGWTAVWIGLIASLVAIAAPFLFPWVSFSGFWEILDAARVQGVEWGEALKHFFPIFLFLLVPLFIAYRAQSKDSADREWEIRPLDLGAFLFTGLIASVISAKPGAGYYQLMPLEPAIFLYARRFFVSPSLWTPKQRAAVFAAALTALSLLLPQQYLFLKQMHGNAKLPVVEDLKDIQARYPDKKIEIGYGDDKIDGDRYHFSWYSPYFVWQGGPFFIDLGVRMEMDTVGRPMPLQLTQVLRDCLVDLWLIQKGERPFEMLGWRMLRIMYPPEFFVAFHESYQKIDSSRFYDIWACKK